VHSTTPSGTCTLLHFFSGYGDGANPQAGLVAANGVLYGTTYGGGAHGKGTLFSVTPHGEETILHDFAALGASSDGSWPVALTKVNGTLYGVTQYGGTVPGSSSEGQGTVFSYTP
jgi:uncharacterized repeat protein (TIGR03803 family)